MSNCCKCEKDPRSWSRFVCKKIEKENRLNYDKPKLGLPLQQSNQYDNVIKWF